MSRNQLKSFPTAILRRGMAHFHPTSRPTVAILAADPLEREPSGSRGLVVATEPMEPQAPSESV